MRQTITIQNKNIYLISFIQTGHVNRNINYVSIVNNTNLLEQRLSVLK